MNNHSEDSNLIDKEIESKFLQQEHRAVHVFLNFFKYKKEDRGDIRRQASTKALFWWFFSPSTVATTGFSFIAIIGLYVAINANNLLKEQTFLVESQRRASLIFELTSILDELDEEIDKIELDTGKKVHEIDNKKEMFVFFPSRRLEGRIISLSLSLKPYRYLGDDGKLIDLPLSPERAQLLTSLISSNVGMGNITSKGDFSMADFQKATLEDITLDKINLSGSKLDESVFFSISVSTANFSNSYMRNMDISRSSFSNGIFLNAKLNDSDFVTSDLSGADFTGAELVNVYFSATNLDGAFLENTNFANSYLAKSTMNEVKFYGSSLKGAYLPSADNLKGADFLDAKLEGAIVPEQDWFSKLKKYNAILPSTEYCVSNDSINRKYTRHYKDLPIPYEDNGPFFKVMKKSLISECFNKSIQQTANAASD